MEPNKKLPLFIITGASCVGKSVMSKISFREKLSLLLLKVIYCGTISITLPMMTIETIESFG